MNGIVPSARIERSDAELAADGNEPAFARLVDAHNADMARLAYVITCDAALAQDAVQAAWIGAWRKLPTLRNPARARSWLLSIAVNEARQIMRRRHRVVVVPIDPNVRAPSRTDPAIGIARLDLVRALAHLSPEDRALLAMRYVLGLDAAEVGDLTGRSASGTRARLSRLTAKVREELGDE